MPVRCLCDRRIAVGRGLPLGADEVRGSRLAGRGYDSCGGIRSRSLVQV